jgi:hypothetical protein
MRFARAAIHRSRTPAGARPLTGLHVIIYEALLFRFHAAERAVCFPSLETLAKWVGCSVSAVQDAIKALEAHRLLSWVHRINRYRCGEFDALGRPTGGKRIARTSNGYEFREPPTMARSARPDRPSNEQKDQRPRNPLHLMVDKVAVIQPSKVASNLSDGLELWLKALRQKMVANKRE